MSGVKQPELSETLHPKTAELKTTHDTSDKTALPELGRTETPYPEPETADLKTTPGTSDKTALPELGGLEAAYPERARDEAPPSEIGENEITHPEAEHNETLLFEMARPEIQRLETARHETEPLKIPRPDTKCQEPKADEAKSFETPELQTAHRGSGSYDATSLEIPDSETTHQKVRLDEAVPLEIGRSETELVEATRNETASPGVARPRTTYPNAEYYQTAPEAIAQSETERRDRYLVMMTHLEVPRKEAGEDAPPLALEVGSLGAIGVFDGLGGAGSRLTMGFDGQKTTAYYASRIARTAAERVLRNFAESNACGESDLCSLMAGDISSTLAAADREQTSDGPRIRGSLTASYPTTVAMLVFNLEAKTDSDVLLTRALWAGDSRCFVLTPDYGLQQLTVDDNRCGLTDMMPDAPMTNYFAANGKNHLNARQFALPRPCILLTASDGCFGYVRSPMHFENILLDAMSQAKQTRDWISTVESRLSSITQDDMTLAAAFVGWPSFASAAECFERRRSVVSCNVSEVDLNFSRADDLSQSAKLARQAAHEHLIGYWRLYSPKYLDLVLPDAG